MILLEDALPEISGDLVCTQIRKSTRTPVIFLSKRTSEEARLAGFAAGGNDFVLKPFFPRELVARIRSFFSLYGAACVGQHVLTAGRLSIDTQSHIALLDGRPLALAPREYDLLLFLCRNPNKAFSRDALLDLVWGQDFVGTERTVDTHVKSLRGKLHPYHNYIATIWGYGYKFEAL